MTTFSKRPSLAIRKLKCLLSTLQRTMEFYEQMALSLKNRQLQQTVIGLAQESRQYARELDAYVNTFGESMDESVLENQENLESWPGAGDEGSAGGEKDIMNWCARFEKSMVNEYRELLNEPFLYEGLRRMIRYQLNGLMHSLAQLKLLNSSLRMG